MKSGEFFIDYVLKQLVERAGSQGPCFNMARAGCKVLLVHFDCAFIRRCLVQAMSHQKSSGSPANPLVLDSTDDEKGTTIPPAPSFSTPSPDTIYRPAIESCPLVSFTVPPNASTLSISFDIPTSEAFCRQNFTIRYRQIRLERIYYAITLPRSAHPFHECFINISGHCRVGIITRCPFYIIFEPCSKRVFVGWSSLAMC
jgi:hypothetical protein